MKTKDKEQKHVLPRHRFWFFILRPFAYLVSAKYHFKPKVTRLKKNKPCLILSNHQAALDPIFLALSFTGPIYFVSSEHIFHKGFVSKLLVHCLAPIPRRKGDLDIKFIMEMIKVSKEGGNIAIFLEGNRTWTNSQFPIPRSAESLVRKLGVDLVLFNLKGGYGVDPRWSNVVRKGKFTSKVARRLSAEEIKEMSDEELHNVIVDALDVKDGIDGSLYKSKKRAEHLERMMYVCPCCKEKNTLRSEGIYVTCSKCNEQIEYTENLKLRYQGSDHELKDYYKMQLDEVKNAVIEEDKEIFSDEGIVLYDQTTGTRVLVDQGRMSLTDKAIHVNDFKLDLTKITSSSLIGGNMITINTDKVAYIAIGDERFNSMKYVHYFGKLVPSIKNRSDNYYGLNIFEH